MMIDIDYITECQIKENYRFNITALSGNKLSKEDRIRRLIPLFMDDKIILPEYGFYVTDIEGVPIDLVRSFVEEEYLAFPVGNHDDMIDALSRIRDESIYAKFPKGKLTPIEKYNLKTHPREQGNSMWL